MTARDWDECIDNAELTLLAVNCHDELVAACEEALNRIDETRECNSDGLMGTILKLKAILAKAKGGA